MKGLNYFKGRDDPVALPEEEYPEWLWRCLDVKAKEGEGGDAGLGDEFCMLSMHPFLATNTTFANISLLNSQIQKIPSSRSQTPKKT